MPEHAYNRINHDVDYHSKLKSFINEVKLELFYLPPISNRSKKMCIAYMLWSHPSYLKMLYYSILSMRTYCEEDIPEIIVFAHEDIAELADSILFPLVGTSCVISMPEKTFFRHNVARHPKLREYEVVLYCDADGMVLSHPSSNLFNNVYAVASRKNTFLCLRVEARSLDNLQSMFESYNQREKRFSSFSEFLEYFKEFSGISQLEEMFSRSRYWIMGGFLAMRTDFYEDEESEEFHEWVDAISSINWSCDETIWLMWSEKHKIVKDSFHDNGIINWQLYCTESEYESYFLKKKWLEKETDIFFHPIVGNTEYPRQILSFFDMVKTDAKRKFNLP
jgi:hypothetical protein